MNGINEQTFKSLCEHLNLVLNDELNGEKPNNDNLLDNKMRILIDVNEIIDSSNGKIDSDNVELNELFMEVFDICSAIKRYSYYVSHFQSAMKKSNNDKDLEESASGFLINRRLLVSAYKKGLEATQKVISLGRVK